MTTALTALKKIQVSGAEATPGTAVAATDCICRRKTETLWRVI
jgi:hypothetical protein